MTDAINTQNRLRSTSVSSDPRIDSNSNKQPAAGASGNAKQSNPSSIVELSSSDLLQNIGDQIDKLPDVNEARVASIKQSLAQGEYKPDAEVIAQKYSEIEKLLP